MEHLLSEIRKAHDKAHKLTACFKVLQDTVTTQLNDRPGLEFSHNRCDTLDIERVELETDINHFVNAPEREQLKNLGWEHVEAEVLELDRQQAALKTESSETAEGLHVAVEGRARLDEGSLTDRHRDKIAGILGKYWGYLM